MHRSIYATYCINDTIHFLVQQDEHDLRLYWKKAQGSKTIHFNYTPFSVKESRVLDCQFGPHYFKQKPTKGKRPWLQSTRKIGCQAHVDVKGFVLYPEFAVSEAENKDSLFVQKSPVVVNELAS